MYKYFENQVKTFSNINITSSQISDYRKLLINELYKLGAKEEDFSLISNKLIINSILNSRKPEDVAWAISQ